MKLRSGVEAINDKRALEKLAAIEQSEGKTARYQIEALMIQAKRVLRAGGRGQSPTSPRSRRRSNAYEDVVKAAEPFSGSGSGAKIGGMFCQETPSRF